MFIHTLRSAVGLRRLATLVLPLALLTGCASGDKQSSQKTAAVESMKDVSHFVGVASGEIDKVSVALDKLTAGGDLKAAFAEYTAAVANIEKAGERAKERRESMQAKGEEYVAHWQKELETTQNPEIRAAMAERKAQVAAKFGKVRDSAGDVRTAYVPYLQNAKDIQKALANDLNADGVKALAPVISKTKAEGETLKAKLAGFSAEVGAIAGSMSATPAPPPAK